MSRRRESAILASKAVFDMVTVGLSWVTAYYLRFHMGIHAPLGVPPPGLYFKLIPFISGIWLLAFVMTGFYSRSLGKRSAVREGIDILQSSAVALMGFIAFSYFYEEYRYSRLTLVLFAV